MKKARYSEEPIVRILILREADWDPEAEAPKRQRLLKLSSKSKFSSWPHFVTFFLG